MHYLDGVGHVAEDSRWIEVAAVDREDGHLVAERGHDPSNMVGAHKSRAHPEQRDGILDEQDPKFGRT
jgi:hypothetical protein